VQLEVFLHAVELGQAALGKIPKGFDSIDVNATGGKMLAFVDSQVLVKTNIDEAVVPSPAIAVNYALRTDSAPDDLLQTFGRTVAYKFRINTPVALIDAEDGLFGSASASLARARTPPDTSRTEKAFINLNYANELFHFRRLMGADQLAKEVVVTVNRVAVDTQQIGRFGCLDVDTEAINNF